MRHAHRAAEKLLVDYSATALTVEINHRRQ
jgi:hypothetical protein